ncbi:MAG: class I SAM-dependent methyltransferase [Synechococcales bacterium]|nr:class I SAM-dependent methyltransferase [Synechococcales bacterium]
METFQVVDLVYLYRKVLQIDVTSEFAALQEISLYHCPESDLQFFDPPIAGSAQFYEKLQQRDHYYADNKDEYHYASQWIQPGDRVLEIGCGKAAFASQIRCAEYHGLEFSPTAVEMAKSQGWQVTQETVQDHAVTHLESYDVVCAFQVLEHVVDVRSFIQASLNCLKPNGILIYSTPSLDSFMRWIPNCALDMPPHHLTRWSDKALQRLAQFYGLTYLDLWHEPLQSFHRQLYLETWLRKKLFDRLQRPFRAIDFSLLGQTLTVLSRFYAKLFGRRSLQTPPVAMGITVVAVYRKSNPARGEID